MMPSSTRAIASRAATLLVASGMLTAARARAAEVLDLTVGTQRVVGARAVTRVAIADPGVADVRVVDQDQVLVTALSPGGTELKLWAGARMLEYMVVVTQLDPQQLKRELEQKLGDRDGVRVRVSRDGTVTLEGTVSTLSDLEKAEQLARQYPQVKDAVRLDPSARTHVAEAMNRQLERAGLSGVRASVVGTVVFLEGVVDTEADLKKVDLITRAIAEGVLNMVSIGSARMVELDVELVEVSRRSLERLGVTWPTDISGSLKLSYDQVRVLAGPGADSARLGVSTPGATASFGLALRFGDGASRTLARPRLVTASGKEAHFLAGGELPIPIVTQERVHIEYKEYGIRLKITPVVDGSGTIRAKVLAEVSSVDDAVTVLGVPGFLTRRVDTEVTLRDGDTLVMSGLMSQSESKDVTKVPLLGHVPILGELFKSRGFQDRQTELVVFVTPRLVDATSRHLRDLSAEMLKKYQEAASAVSFGILD
jgi:pilus assembly protein CpaC